MKRIASLTSTVLLALGIAAFAGSALAGNGKGNGAENANTSAPAATEQAANGPGNSENAPGQLKKDTTSSQVKGGGSADQNTTTSVGVKPTNATAKDTHALATSNQTKRYGNGTTAGQVAVQAGYTGMLHGPGNSQPHKAALCGPEVDVHALDAPGQQKKCLTSPTTQPTPTSKVVTPTVTPAGVPSPAAVSVSGGVKGVPAAGGAPAPAAPQGGVLGVTTSGGPVGGVLGAIEAVGEGALPFTGFPLWAAMAIALALIVLGLTLRRRARVTV
jgi:hypothetical protein